MRKVWLASLPGVVMGYAGVGDAIVELIRHSSANTVAIQDNSGHLAPSGHPSLAPDQRGSAGICQSLESDRPSSREADSPPAVMARMSRTRWVSSSALNGLSRNAEGVLVSVGGLSGGSG